MDGSVSEYYSLRDLKNEIIDLKGKIENQLKEDNNDKRYEDIIRRKSRDKLISLRKYNGNFNAKNLVFRLIKEDEKDLITVYYEDMAIGYVSNDLSVDYEKLFSNASELTSLPKTSYAKYFCKYPGRYNYPTRFGGGSTILELLDDDLSIKQEELKLKKK